MTKIAKIAREAMELIAPEVRPRPKDEEVISTPQNSGWTLSLGGGYV